MDNGVESYYADWSPDSSRIVTADAAGVAKIWDTTTGQVQLELASEIPKLQYAEWSSDGRYILTYCENINMCRQVSAQIWDATTGTLLLTLSERVIATAWDPSGDRVMIRSIGADFMESVQIWAVPN